MRASFCLKLALISSLCLQSASYGMDPRKAKLLEEAGVHPLFAQLLADSGVQVFNRGNPDHRTHQLFVTNFMDAFHQAICAPAEISFLRLMSGFLGEEPNTDYVWPEHFLRVIISYGISNAQAAEEAWHPVLMSIAQDRHYGPFAMQIPDGSLAAPPALISAFQALLRQQLEAKPLIQQNIDLEEAGKPVETLSKVEDAFTISLRSFTKTLFLSLSEKDVESYMENGEPESWVLQVITYIIFEWTTLQDIYLSEGAFQGGQLTDITPTGLALLLHNFIPLLNSIVTHLIELMQETELAPDEEKRLEISARNIHQFILQARIYLMQDYLEKNQELVEHNLALLKFYGDIRTKEPNLFEKLYPFSADNMLLKWAGETIAPHMKNRTPPIKEIAATLFEQQNALACKLLGLNQTTDSVYDKISLLSEIPLAWKQQGSLDDFDKVFLLVRHLKKILESLLETTQSLKDARLTPQLEAHIYNLWISQPLAILADILLVYFVQFEGLGYLEDWGTKPSPKEKIKRILSEKFIFLVWGVISTDSGSAEINTLSRKIIPLLRAFLDKEMLKKTDAFITSACPLLLEKSISLTSNSLAYDNSATVFIKHVSDVIAGSDADFNLLCQNPPLVGQAAREWKRTTLFKLEQMKKKTKKNKPEDIENIDLLAALIKRNNVIPKALKIDVERVIAEHNGAQKTQPAAAAPGKIKAPSKTKGHRNSAPINSKKPPAVAKKNQPAAIADKQTPTKEELREIESFKSLMKKMHDNLKNLPEEKIGLFQERLSALSQAKNIDLRSLSALDKEFEDTLEQQRKTVEGKRWAARMVEKLRDLENQDLHDSLDQKQQELLEKIDQDPIGIANQLETLHNQLCLAIQAEKETKTTTAKLRKKAQARTPKLTNPPKASVSAPETVPIKPVQQMSITAATSALEKKTEPPSLIAPASTTKTPGQKHSLATTWAPLRQNVPMPSVSDDHPKSLVVESSITPHPLIKALFSRSSKQLTPISELSDEALRNSPLQPSTPSSTRDAIALSGSREATPIPHGATEEARPPVARSRETTPTPESCKNKTLFNLKPNPHAPEFIPSWAHCAPPDLSSVDLETNAFNSALNQATLSFLQAEIKKIIASHSRIYQSIHTLSRDQIYLYELQREAALFRSTIDFSLDVRPFREEAEVVAPILCQAIMTRVIQTATSRKTEVDGVWRFFAQLEAWETLTPIVFFIRSRDSWAPIHFMLYEDDILTAFTNPASDDPSLVQETHLFVIYLEVRIPVYKRIEAPNQNHPSKRTSHPDSPINPGPDSWEKSQGDSQTQRNHTLPSSGPGNGPGFEPTDEGNGTATDASETSQGAPLFNGVKLFPSAQK
jgi:hypothetical protein